MRSSSPDQTCKRAPMEQEEGAQWIDRGGHDWFSSQLWELSQSSIMRIRSGQN